MADGLVGPQAGMSVLPQIANIYSSEVLSYVQFHFGKSPRDNIVSAVTNFFTIDEISSGKDYYTR